MALTNYYLCRIVESRISFIWRREFCNVAIKRFNYFSVLNDGKNLTASLSALIKCLIITFISGTPTALERFLYSFYSIRLIVCIEAVKVPNEKECITSCSKNRFLVILRITMSFLKHNFLFYVSYWFTTQSQHSVT